MHNGFSGGENAFGISVAGSVGNVANDVETEQILEEISTTWSDQPMISSFIHIRGSVPIYWYQEFNSILPKPTIKPEIITAEIIMPTKINAFFILNLNQLNQNNNHKMHLRNHIS